MGLLLIGLQFPDAQADAAFRGRGVNHLGPDRVSHLEGRHFLLIPALLRDVDEALDAFLHLDEEAEVGDVGDGAGDHGVHRETIVDGLPGVVGQVLDAQGEALVVLVDVEDLDHLALLE